MVIRPCSPIVLCVIGRKPGPFAVATVDIFFQPVLPELLRCAVPADGLLIDCFRSSFRLIHSRQTGLLFGLACSPGVKRRSQPTRPLVFTRGSVFPVVLLNSSFGSISGQRVCPLFWDVHQ